MSLQIAIPPARLILSTFKSLIGNLISERKRAEGNYDLIYFWKPIMAPGSMFHERLNQLVGDYIPNDP